MKRLIALAALLIAASACTTTTDNTNTGAANANANANANAAAAATPAGVSQADLEAKEHAVWDAIKAKNYDAFNGLIADDLVLVADDGVYNRAQTLDMFKQYDLTDYSFSDVKFVKVDDDLAVLIYTSTETSTVGGKPSPESGKKVYNGSAWANRGGKWVGVFHQETLSEPMPAGQGGNMNANTASAANANKPGANANTSASPAASPAAPATATDAEKAVWDAIKAKNSDAFASFLASNSVEVEPEGILDKAASVKTITQFDASKYTLSDFKETKLDSDSTLVTYAVKGPGPKGPEMMRHSTVWNNRGGKWTAYFHQGTTATK